MTRHTNQLLEIELTNSREKIEELKALHKELLSKDNTTIHDLVEIQKEINALNVKIRRIMSRP